MPHSYLLAASRPWFTGMSERLSAATGAPFHMVTTPMELKSFDFETINPRYIFVPHWSWILPETLWSRFETVIFHMTDLPFGRGGSPMQNLIVRGVKETKITALRCDREIDAGPIYMKTPLSLEGTAEQIFLRTIPLIENMILTLVHTEPQPEPQTGAPVFFCRRTPEEGDISELESLEKVYDFIRMLDASTYPPAFLETDSLRLEFSNAVLGKGKVEASVTISIKESDK